MDKRIKKQIRARAKTIMSKLMEIQDIQRNTGVHIMPCSTEGFVQDLTNVVYVED